MNTSQIVETVQHSRYMTEVGGYIFNGWKVMEEDDDNLISGRRSYKGDIIVSLIGTDRGSMEWQEIIGNIYDDIDRIWTEEIPEDMKLLNRVKGVSQVRGKPWIYVWGNPGMLPYLLKYSAQKYAERAFARKT